jgi:hypothetical protein
MTTMLTTMLSGRGIRVAMGAVALILLAIAPGAEAVTDTTQFSVTAGSLALTTNPVVPVLPTLTLNGNAQTLNATMSGWTAVDATGSGSGWNLNVIGDSSAGKSAVFKEYCTDGTATNGCSTAVSGAPGPGYVTTSPQTLTANSLKLNSTSATMTAGGGSTGYSATSVALTAPTTIKAIGTGNKVYRLDMIWTLATGP